MSCPRGTSVMDKAVACYPGGRGSIQAGNYNPRPVMPHTADGALLADFYASKIGKSIALLRDSTRKSLDSKVCCHDHSASASLFYHLKPC